MQNPPSRTEKIKLRGDSAIIYTLLGMLWASVALYSVPQAYKSILWLGIAVPVLLLIARWIRIRRESIEIHTPWEPDRSGLRRRQQQAVLALALGVLSAILITVLLLSIIDKKEWIAPCVATLFALHFYLLPPSLLMWEDILIASTAAVAAIVTPFWFPAQYWLWWLVACAACALACWLVADLRFQSVLGLQEEERREIDGAAFNP